MKRMSGIKLLGCFLKENVSYLVLYLLFAGSMLLVSGLASLPFAMTGYALVLCGFILFCFLLYRFCQYARNYQKLVSVINNLENSVDGMPELKTVSAMLYQEMIRSLYEERLLLLQEKKRNETDRNDYYTMWIHQIKTPIAAMHLLLQAMENGSGKYRLEQELFQIEQYAEMALHYSRLHNIGSDLLLKKYDLYEIVKQAVKKYSMVFIEKRLTLNFEEFHYDMITDEKWLQFVMEQILSNAVKYTANGGVTIEFVEEPKPQLIISDTGIGINEADQPRIFEKGFTGFNGHMDKRSTGIGLYLCRQVVDALGIEIRVESKPREGSRFYLEFIRQ